MAEALKLDNADITTTSIGTPNYSEFLMKFAKKTQTCMGCKKPLTAAHEKEGAVCENCRPRIGELYQKQLSKVSELGRRSPVVPSW